MHVNCILYINEFGHHVFVDVKTSGCIEDNYVKIVLNCVIYGIAGDNCGLNVGSHGENFGFNLFTVTL